MPADPFEVSEAVPCHVGQYTYPSGSDDVPDPVSCNACTCDEGDLTTCTDIGCATPCPTGTERGTDCELCGDFNCDILHTGCLSTCTNDADCVADGAFCNAGVCSRLCQ